MIDKEKDANFSAASLKRRLLTYSAAAGAVLTMANPASAAIQYSGPKDISVNKSTPHQFIDLNGDGITDFDFPVFSVYLPPSIINRGVAVAGYATGNDALVSAGSQPYRLGFGEMISSGAQGGWLYGWLNGQFTSNGTVSYELGNFLNHSGYMGVRFGINGNTHYGWIAYEGTGYAEGKISGWAYEDVADTAIAAGDTGTTPIPTLNQWGIIFLMGLILMEGARRIKRTRDEA